MCAGCSVTVIARVQRKINLMQGRSIQKSDSSREEAVLESVGTCPQTFVSFSQRKMMEERMSGVCGVLNYAGCFAEAAGSVDRVNSWDAGLRDGLGYIHDLL